MLQCMSPPWFFGSGCMHDSVTTKGILKSDELEVVKFFIHTRGTTGCAITWHRCQVMIMSGYVVEPALKYEWRKASKDCEKRGFVYGTETAGVFEP
jgi:DNA phosphorothioation-dependent restriction protein DptG